MAKLCDAVQHVHLQGVVHRDLKPANILVSEARPEAEDARDAGESGETQDAVASGKAPIPVLIDFGLAKSVNPDAPLASAVVSGIGSFAGTYAYAAPEQIRQKRDEDTGRQADIYALGAVLFELVVGVSPMEHVLSDTTLSDPERTLRLADDERPSMAAAFARLAPARQQEVAQARGATVDAMKRLLRSRIAHLADRALRSKPTARFSDARAFALDIANYLADRDFIEAAAEPRIEKWRRAFRRNRAAFAGVAGVIAALTAGVVATGLALGRALEAERGLETQLAETEKAQLAEKERADQLKKVSDFQAGMLGQIDTKAAGEGLMIDVRERFAGALEKAGVPEAERAARSDALRQELVKVNATDAAAAMIDRTILKPAIKTIDERFKDDPATDASLRQALAELYIRIGLYDAAFPLQESALEKRRRTLGEEHPSTLIAINNMGILLQDQGRLAEAEPFFRETLEKRRRTLGEEHPDTLACAQALVDLYTAWDKAEPGKGYDAKAAEWRSRIEPPAAVPQGS